MKLKRQRRRRKRNSTGSAPRLLRVNVAEDVSSRRGAAAPWRWREAVHRGLLGEEADYGVSS